jgi:hypothetical protein
MSSDKLNISTFIENALPSFIKEEFTKFSDFFRDYYKSLEISGGVLDVSNNLLSIRDFSNLTKNNLVEETSLTQSLTSTDTTISVLSTLGFPEENGLVLIDSEIIFYTSKTDTQFLNCSRGYSGTTTLKDVGTRLTTTTPDSHENESSVRNISKLLLFAMVKNYQDQYLDGFPYTQLDSEVDQITLLENIKDFYSFKGTTTSIQFLFQSIFAEEVTVIFPKEYLIKSSTSNWSVDDIIKVEAISGNPAELVGYEIFQTDISNTPSVSAKVDTILINSISSYNSGSKFIHEIKLNILNRHNFIVPSSTILRREISQTSNVITVDSTIGFPEENGIIQIGNEYISYRTKSFHQFSDCVRGLYGTVASTHPTDAEVTTTEYLYGYKEGIESEDNIIKLRLLGVMSSFSIDDGSSYYETDERVTSSLNGVVDYKPQFTTFLLNENGLLCSSSDQTINNRVNKILGDVGSVYRTDPMANFAYVSSTGFPTHSIGPFSGISGYPGDQLLLRKIPLLPEVAIQVEPIGEKATGIFVNGVESYSHVSTDYETYGYIESVDIVNGGIGFLDGVQPVFRLTGGGGSAASFSGVTANGRVISVSVTNGGSGYTSDPDIEIAYGFDATATIANDTDIISGSIRNITVTNGGTQYIVAPEVVIRDITGRGRGAYATANISGGVVTSINILNGGVDYDNRNNIIITLVSKGTGVVARANVKKWKYNRVFQLSNTFIDSTQSWIASTAKCDASNGYLYSSLDVQLGMKYAYALNPKLLRYRLDDNVQGVSSNYQEISTGFSHSPIIGWSYDGVPIYGPYGYSDPLDDTSSISRMTSSYSLVSTTSTNRPPISSYPLGCFVDDYEYLNGLGDLDQHNGRFCKTPEYPDGIYAYFITVDQYGSGVYPYIIGNSYKYVPNFSNFSVEHTQKENQLPLSCRRLRTVNTPSSGNDVQIFVNSTDRGVIESYGVNGSENNCKVGDFLVLDNSGTEGSGAFAKVGEVGGVTVSSATYSVASGFTASGVTIASGLTQFPYPTSITSPVVIPYEVEVTTDSPHQLSENDQITVEVTPRSTPLEINYKVRVSSYQLITYDENIVETTLSANVAFNSTIISVNNATRFSNDDYIIVNSEIMRIISISISGTLSGNLTVSRAELGSTLALHNATNIVRTYIPEGDSTYEISVGDTLTDGSASGIISSIDSENHVIEVRVLIGDFVSSSIIFDNSSPQKQILIDSITTKENYWEIDPSNTGNYFVRNLDFEMIRGTKYILDVSDPSISGYYLAFSEDFNNVNQINYATYTGVAGDPGATVTFDEDIFRTVDISRIYYYELRNRVVNNRNSFIIKDSYASGIKNITLIDPYRFKYQVNGQLEERTFTYLRYSTTSESAVGEIISVVNLDGGDGYKRLPKVVGITHTEIDSAKFTYRLVGGIFDSVSIINRGRRYSSNSELSVVSNTGTGAVLVPTIVDGEITSVAVESTGRGYSSSDKIIVIDRSPSIYPKSDSIGKIKTIRFNNYGSQFTVNRTLAQELKFNVKLLVSGLNPPYRVGELLTTPNNLSLKTVKITEIGKDSYLLDIQILSGNVNDLYVGLVITGLSNLSTSTIREIKYPQAYGIISGYVPKYGYFDDDLGKISSSSQKITDSYYYQDYSYVVKTSKSLRSYRKQLNRSTHALGFKLFGEVVLENDTNFTSSGNTSGSSIILPDNPTQYEVVITASGINVESSLSYTRKVINVIKQHELRQIPGEGAAFLNAENNDVNNLAIEDISDQFNGVTKQFSLVTSDGSSTNDMETYSTIIALNQVIQEPIEEKNIDSISYNSGLATITLDEDHNYAYSSSGVTYPTSRYITVTGVTASGLPYEFNDTFEIYDVPAPNSVVVLFENEVGTTTNNDPAVCADVQHTVDNLVGILTNTLAAGSIVSLPTRNEGIWSVTSENSTVIAANRHRDASNLIQANRQEIIDRANAEIAVQYPDFYYPNDPQTTPTSRYKDSYRLIQLNRQEIIDGAFAEIAIIHPTFVNPNSDKCKRDIGYFIDAISLDVHTGGNVYARKFLRQYFNANGTSLTSNGLAGEVLESITAFNKARDLMKDAITNQLTVQDLTITPDPLTGSNTDPNSCADVRSNIDNLVGIVTFYLNQGSLTSPTPLVDETIGTTSYGSTVTFDPSDSQTYTIGSTSYPVMGSIFVPDDGATLDLVIAFHGTLPEGGTQTIAESSEIVLDVLTNPNGMNIRDKIIFSVAYPQDHISQSRQYNLPGVGREAPAFIMGSNLPYARAAVEWAKSNIVSFLASQGITKSIGDVYMFGHSQGGKIVTKLNTIVTGIAGVVANAPGPIQFDQTCAANPGNYTCSKIAAIYGPASTNPTPYTNIGLETYTTGHNAPILFTQALDDTTGGGNQSQWLRDFIIAINSNPNPTVTVSTVPSGGHDAFVENPQLQNSIRVFIGTTITGEAKCRRDIGYIIDSVSNDLFTGGNSNILDSTLAYFTTSGTTLIPNGVEGEVNESIVAFNKARDMMKLALANQLYSKDFTIIPDFIPASGVLSSSDITGSKIIKGNYDIYNGSVEFMNAPGEGAEFYCTSYKFVSPSDQARYVYKVKNIVFDGSTDTFDLYKIDGSPLTTETDENLLVFVDGVIQYYGESYTIDRTISPNRIIFTVAPRKETRFFAFSTGKYKFFDDITSQIDGSQTSFNLQINSENYKIGQQSRLIVFLDGVPQEYGTSYIIRDSIITFREAPSSSKKCKLFFFYGKTFDKSLTIYNGKVFEPIFNIGSLTPDGCEIFTVNNTTKRYLSPGDFVKIEGETPKEIIEVKQDVIENSNNLIYTALVFTDISPIKGKNAVLEAVVSGSSVTSINILNAGEEYQTAPVILFKPACDNPGVGAEAQAIMSNGAISSVNILNPGSGYTAAPEVIIAKKYEIIKEKYPVYIDKDLVSVIQPDTQQANFLTIGSTISSTVSGTTAVQEIYLPTVYSQIASVVNPVVVIDNIELVDDRNSYSNPAETKLGNRLKSLDDNKFLYEPINLDLNGENFDILGSNVTIETMNRFMPDLTINDFITRTYSRTGENEFNEFNIGLDSHITIGGTLLNSISDTDNLITVSGNTNYFPTVSGYVLFGNELIQYTTISGQTLLNCSRGMNGTTPSTHNSGDYFNIAWRG